MDTQAYLKTYMKVVGVAVQGTADILAYPLDDPDNLDADLSLTAFHTQSLVDEVLDTEVFTQQDIRILWEHIETLPYDFEEGLTLESLPDMLNDFIREAFAKIIFGISQPPITSLRGPARSASNSTGKNRNPRNCNAEPKASPNRRTLALRSNRNTTITPRIGRGVPFPDVCTGYAPRKVKVSHT